jgi:hypothetical protein
MNYQIHYEKLINNRKLLNRSKKDKEYYEKHHIIPKSMGGTNAEDNLILLTAREHYVAHWLLYRIYSNSDNMAYAFWKMTFPGTKFTKRKYKISSVAYCIAKNAMAAAQRRKNIGRKVAPEHLYKWKGNKNFAKKVYNVITGETYDNSKQLWREKYSDILTYSAFNYYLRKKIKGRNINRKLADNDIYNWNYVKEAS